MTTDWSAEVSVGGFAADSVLIDSDTQVTATFTMGNPPLSAASVPTLIFRSQSTSTAHHASNAVEISNALAITDSTSALACSFAGGCSYEVTSNGLASLLKSDSSNNFVEICGSKCEFNDEASSDSLISCKLPLLSTSYSNTNFGIATPSVLSGEAFGTGENPEIVFDGEWTVTHNPGTHTCHVGMKFKEGYVGILDQMKFFMPA